MEVSGEAKHLSLLPPFNGAIAQSLDTNAPRQAAFNGGLNKVRREEGQRDDAVDLPHAAAFALGDALDICIRVTDELAEPTPAPERAPPAWTGKAAGRGGARDRFSRRRLGATATPHLGNGPIPL